MKLHFRSNDLEGKLWQQRAADRLRHALRRLHGLVARITVRLDDINGPAGGVDKRCSVEVLVRGGSPVAVTATARSWQDSVEAVASRVRQRVVMQLHRATLVQDQPAALAPSTSCLSITTSTMKVLPDAQLPPQQPRSRRAHRRARAHF